jgi:pyruvate dehydrogenase E1 component alpha subunit
VSASATTTKPQAPGGLGAERLELFLHQMMLIRRFEEKAGEMYTKGKIRGFLHLYTGQEACAVGAINTLAEQDHLFTHYRDHGHAIARGMDPKRVMAELYGRADGVSGGRGGSMHLYDTSINFHGGYAIVAAHLPLAVGMALATRMRKEDSVTMCFFGDGSVGEGEFHEALNLAALWKTPVVFFCENNLYGMGVPLKESLSTNIATLAGAYKMPAVTINGMDVIEVHRETEKAVAQARAGGGPYFIEAMTYRYRAHSMSDPELYRSKSEIAEYRKRDCIDRLHRAMTEQGMIDDARFAELTKQVDAEVDEAVAFAEESPQPALSTLFDNIYVEGEQ